MKTGKTLEVLDRVNFGSRVFASPVAVDGILYVASTGGWLWAMQGAVGVNPLPLQVLDCLLTGTQSLKPDIKITLINGDAEQSKIGVIVINEQNV